MKITSNENNLSQIRIYADSPEYETQALAVAERINCEYSGLLSDAVRNEHTPLFLSVGSEGVSLSDGNLSLTADFTHMISRLRRSNLQREMLIKAARLKDNDSPILLDATAGLGDDSLILAASGFNVELYEINPVINTLLTDAVRKAAAENENNGSFSKELFYAASRMNVHFENSINAMQTLDYTPDVILLDPMFPERQKSALVKKKFQLLQQLECPSSDLDSAALLEAAMNVHPKKIIIKRPLKGPYLADKKPHYSLSGKAIRYDCFVF